MISIAVNLLIFLIAAQHLFFLVLEMFYWDKPLGRRVFRHSQQFAEASKTLAMNQGLYNGFLAAGLIWGLIRGAGSGAAEQTIVIFFLCCVLIAGVFGGLTVSRKILVVQALPAAITLGLIILF